VNRYYRVLDLPYNATLAEIKQAYRELVRIWHPDRYSHDERLQKRATEKLIELNEAYRVLCSLNAQPPDEQEPTETAADPIDWSPPAPKQSPPPKQNSSSTAPQRQSHKSFWPWVYSIVVVPLVGLGIVFLFNSKSNSRSYTPNPLPPPRDEVAFQPSDLADPARRQPGETDNMENYDTLVVHAAGLEGTKRNDSAKDHSVNASMDSLQNHP
jgi:hypothetical protein